LSITQNFTC